MNRIKKLIDKFKGNPTVNVPPPPEIMTAWGPVPESARLQAEANMRLDPIKRQNVLNVLIKEANGDTEAGKTEFRRRYPNGGAV